MSEFNLNKIQKTFADEFIKFEKKVNAICAKEGIEENDVIASVRYGDQGKIVSMAKCSPEILCIIISSLLVSTSQATDTPVKDLMKMIRKVNKYKEAKPECFSAKSVNENGD